MSRSPTPSQAPSIRGVRPASYILPIWQWRSFTLSRWRMQASRHCCAETRQQKKHYSGSPTPLEILTNLPGRWH